MASRGQSFSLGNPWASTALVMLKYAGQMLQRPHFAYSLTALTADSATTHSVVQSLHVTAMSWLMMVVVVGYLMVSTWRFYSFKDINFGSRRPFRTIVLIAVVFA